MSGRGWLAAAVTAVSLAVILLVRLTPFPIPKVTHS